MRHLIGAAFAAVFVLVMAQAQAAELKWEMVLKLDHASTTVADAAIKRNVGILAISGKADVAGEKADVAVHVLADYTNGSGPWQSYMTLSFADGSVLTTYGNGITRADAKGLNSRFHGTLTVIDGTGRYAGMHGGGSMIGQRAPKVGDDVMIHYTIALDLQK